MDASKGIQSGRAFVAQTKEMSAAMQEAFGNKLKSLISFAAIEEATRRTGEWAVALTQMSKAMGLSSESLQTLNVIAAKSSTNEEAVAGMYDSIKNAADAALSGNSEMITSFRRLGVEINGNMKTVDIFAAVMNKIPNAEALNNSGQFIRQSVKKLTGQSGEVAADYAEGFRSQQGETMADKTAGLKQSGSIASAETLATISANWSAIKQDLKDAGNMLLPVADLLISAVKVLTEALAGIAEAVFGAGEIISAIWTGDMDKMKEGMKKAGGIIIGGIIGILNIVPQVLGSLLQNKFLSKIPGVKALAAKLKEGEANEEEYIHQKLGINQKTLERGAALGNVVAMIATMGESAVGGAAKGADSLAGMAERVGLKGAGKNLRGAGKRLRGSTGPAKWEDLPIGVRKAKIEESQLAGEDEEAAMAKYNKARKAEKNIRDHPTGAGVAGASLVGSGESGKSNRAAFDEKINPDLTKAMTPISSGGGNLKIGGMFGAGETRMIALSVKMVELLTHIKNNTNPVQNATRMTGQGGGQGVAGGR